MVTLHCCLSIYLCTTGSVSKRVVHSGKNNRTNNRINLVLRCTTVQVTGGEGKGEKDTGRNHRRTQTKREKSQTDMAGSTATARQKIALPEAGHVVNLKPWLVSVFSPSPPASLRIRINVHLSLLDHPAGSSAQRNVCFAIHLLVYQWMEQKSTLPLNNNNNNIDLKLNFIFPYQTD